jgi:Fe-S-cluster containining protein
MEKKVVAKKQSETPAQKPGRKPFYAEGIRFECQGSGKCCTSRGSYGYVYLNEADQKRMAKFFKLTVPAFLKKYCGTKDGWIYILDPRELGYTDHKEGDCLFLDGNRCNVYEARPEHCRTWPFWPENMNPKTWNTEIAAFCPGVGKGKLHTREEIEAVLAEQKPKE